LRIYGSWCINQQHKTPRLSLFLACFTVIKKDRLAILLYNVAMLVSLSNFWIKWYVAI